MSNLAPRATGLVRRSIVESPYQERSRSALGCVLGSLSGDPRGTPIAHAGYDECTTLSVIMIRELRYAFPSLQSEMACYILSTKAISSLAVRWPVRERGTQRTVTSGIHLQVSCAARVVRVGATENSVESRRKEIMKGKHRSLIWLRTITAISLVAISYGASAQDFTSQSFIKQGDETFTLNLGGIFNQFGTSLKLNGPGLNGSDFNLENSGLQRNLSSFDAAGTWRFLSRNRIDVLYFSAKRSGGRTIDRDLNIDGVVVPIDSTLSTEVKNQFVDLDYRFSFLKTDEVEIAGLLGVYGGQYRYQISATQPLTGGGQSTLLNVTTSTTVPLPLIGASLDWYINPRWKISGSASGIKAHVGNVDGSAFVGSINTEYMIVRNFGIGLGYMYSDLSVDVTKNSFNGNIGWKMNSVSLYGQFKF